VRPTVWEEMSPAALFRIGAPKNISSSPRRPPHAAPVGRCSRWAGPRPGVVELDARGLDAADVRVHLRRQHHHQQPP
jgi:hypothetical protein